MKYSHKKSFDWYSMQQRYSIRKYHFGAASVLLGTALVLGTAANAQAVQAKEQHPEATNSVSVDKVEETTKPAEVSTPKKETTYAAPTVAIPVEVTPAKSDEAKAPAEKVEEAKDKKEEVTQQDAVDKSKLLTALSRAEKLELKLYTEESVKRLQSSLQSAQVLLNRAKVTESELSQAESELQAAVIALELRGATTTKVTDKTEVVNKIESAEKKNAESKVAEQTSEVDKESVEKDKTALKPVKGLRVEDAKANIKGGWNIPLDQEASLRLKSAIEAHAAQGSSRRRKRAIGDLDYTFKKVMTPVNPGFYADAKSVDELTVNPDYINETVVNVWYKDLGYINLVDKDGHYINANGEVVENKEDAIRRQYRNDFNDTTRADVTEIPQAPVGWKISDNQSIHGYDAETKTIDPNDDNDLDAVGKDSNVVIEKENQKAIIRYVSTNGNSVLTTDEVTGKSGEAIAYSTTSQINEFKKQGYKLVSDEFTSGGAKVYDYDTARDQVYTVTLSERVEPVNPDNPTPQPNTPVNPGQPDSPRWPGTVENLDNKESVSRTIHYVYEDGSKAKDDVVETLNFKRWSNVNLVTGHIDFQDWTTNDDTFDKVVSPSIAGYTADKSEIPAVSGVKAKDQDRVETVTYRKDAQKAVIRYVSTNGNRVLTTDEVTGKSGEAIAYSTTSQINEFKKQGYKLVSDEFTAGGAKVYDYDTARDQVYTVTLSERVEPVNPDNPTPQPNTPVNPGQPDSPRWPATVHDLDNKESVSRTIHYVYEDGSKAKDDVVETLNFKRWSRINLVTGQIFFQDWATNDDTFDKVVSPSIAGYTADKSEIPAVSGVKAKDQDRVETVTYRKDAQKAVIRYVSTNGNRVLTTDEVTGKSGEAIAYSTTSQINEFKKQGYKLVSDEFTAGGTKVYDYDTARDQVYTVTLSERVEPVNPDNPTPQPNTPVNPGQPDSPRWPGTVENLDNKESVSRTIHYVYEDGSEAKDDVVETLNFKRWSNVNLVTGHIDFQDWTTNDDTFDKVVSPTIAGYTADKSEIPAVSGVQAKDQDRVETVTYRKDAQKAVIRYVSTNGNRVLTTDEVTGKSGEAIAYSTTSQINEFKKQGYKLVSDEFTAGGAKVYDYDTARDQVYTVTLSERVEPVNPDNPTPQPNTPVNPGQPDSPRWPGTVENLDNKESVSRTIHYVYEDGSKAKDDVVETLNFKRWSNVNLVTGHIDFQDWTTNDDTFDKVVSPTIAGYTADKSEIPAVSGVQAKDQDRVETVTYRKDAQKAIIRYVSTNGNSVLTTDEVTGKSGEAIAYSTTSQINEFKKQGYKLVSDEFTSGGAKVYDYDTARDQVYTVTLSERVEPVNPDNPTPQPNTPVNPGQPDSPRWPGTVENLDNKESVSRTIHYVYEDGSKAKDDVVETLNFKRWSNVNLVTGHIDFQDWTTNDDTFDKVVSPTIAGYTADKSEIPAVSGVQAKDQDRVETVTYRKDAQKAIIRYVSTNGNRVLTTDEVTGKSGEAIAYSTTSQITEFKKQGYKLVSDEFTAGGAKVYDYDTARDQVYTVTLSERVEPVNPDNPTPQPNTPVNPGQPDSPRWPGTVENLDNKESVSRTIHYVYEDGSKAKDDVVETLNFKRWSRINLVTGQIFFQDWATNDDTFDKVVSPSIAGYTADKSEIPAVSGVKAKDQDRVETVTYRKDAQKAVIRYVSTNGNRVLTTDEVTGKSGEAIAYSTTSQINEFKKQGYKLVSDEFTAGGTKVYDYDTARDQVYTVTLSERVEPVNPDNPTPQPNTPVNPGQPDSPRWPGTVENLDNKESVSRTIHYVYEDGSKAKDDVVETLNFKRWSNVNLVTGHIDFQDWTTNDDTFDKVVSPTIAGYTADKSEIPAVSGVQAKDQDRVETVTYRKDAQKAVIRYVSTNGNRVLTTDEVTGKSGEAIAYSTTSQINEFKKQGYKLVSDEFTAGGAKVYDYDTARDQVYTVTLSERVEPVNPDNPTPQPNTPVNPGQPDSPRWPGTVENLDNKESVSRTIHYVYEDGSKAKDDVVETLNFKRWSNVNLVTGHIDFQDWTTNDDTFDKVVSPTIAGYTADKSEIPAVSGVQAKDQDRVETVTYRKDAQKAIIRYVSTNGNRVLTTDEVTGKSGEAIAYSTTSQINEFKKQGYKLVSDEFTAGGTKVYDYDTARDQVYTVTLSERVEPVNPDNPTPQPNTPVNPGQPDSPRWPGTVENLDNKESVSRTIHYVYEDGSKAKDDVVETLNFKRWSNVNLVTGHIDFQDWTTNDDTFDKVVSPTIAGYTADKSEIPAVSGVQAKDQDRVETVTYRKDAQKAIIRYVSTNGNRVLTTDEVTGKSGEAIAYSTTSQITEFKKQGYKLVSDEFTAGGAKVYDYDTARDQVYTVTLSERVEPVNPDNPTPQPNTPVNPGQPDSPRWPGTVENLDNKESVSRTIHYVYEDGSKAKDDVVETLNFKRWSNVNLVTGHIDFQDWTTNDDTFDKVVSPTIAGYTADKSEIPAVSGVKAKDQDRVETVTYRKDAQKAVIRYVSTNGNRVLTTDEVTGKSGEAIAYSTTSQITEFKKQGYKLVSDEFTSGGAKVYDYDTARDQVYTVTLSERVERVTPKDPKPQPNTPVNPGQPNTPNWPRTVERMEKLTQTISRRINFRYSKNGKAAYGTIDQHISYERNALVNLVSGDINYEPWKITGIKNQDVVAPVASQPSATTPTVANNSVTRVVRSSSVRLALAPQVNNSQESPVGLTVTENGEHSVLRSSRGKRATVAEPDSSTNSEADSSVNAVFKAVRTPITPKFYATVNKVGTMEVNPDSPQDTEVNVDLKEMGRIVAVNNKGQYINEQGEVVQNIEDALYKYYDNDPNDATKAAETKIPEAPKFHVLNNTQPTVWGYNIVDKTIEPNDESDPDRIGKDTFVTYNEIIDSVSKETEQTVSFTGAGSATPKDNVQNDFVFKGSYNEATKETTWENKDHTYGTVKVPVVTGYFANKAEAGGKTVTPDLPKATDTVTYKVLGKIIPVDASGNVIVNAPQPQYMNDANDPRKAGETAVPEIVGYKPERTSVTPENPGEDTKVTYVKTEQVAVVRYIDVDNKNEVVHTDNITGKSGEKIAYTTETVLKSLLEKGYLLQEDGFPADATFDTDETKVQEYTVLLKHKITVKKDAPKVVERTIHYVFADGTKASEDHHEQVSFSRMLSIDNVTGKTTSTSWVSKDGVTSFEEVVSPTIAGYKPDLAKVDSVQGITAETDNQVVTVTYRNVQPIPQVTPTPIPTPTPTPQVTPTPVPTSTPAPKVPSAVPTSTPAPKEEEKELPKTAGHSSGMAQVLGVLGLFAGFSLVGKSKRDE